MTFTHSGRRPETSTPSKPKGSRREERTAVREVFAEHQAGQGRTSRGLGKLLFAPLEVKLPRVSAVAVEQVKGPIEQGGIIVRCVRIRTAKSGLPSGPWATSSPSRQDAAERERQHGQCELGEERGQVMAVPAQQADGAAVLEHLEGGR